jgi:hypothetical protein
MIILLVVLIRADVSPLGATSKVANGPRLQHEPHVDVIPCNDTARDL